MVKGFSYIWRTGLAEVGCKCFVFFANLWPCGSKLSKEDLHYMQILHGYRLHLKRMHFKWAITWTLHDTKQEVFCIMAYGVWQLFTKVFKTILLRIQVALRLVLQ